MNIIKAIIYLSLPFSSLFCQNQTDDLSPVFSESALPFSIQLDLASFTLPTGIQAYAKAMYDGKWILLCGRTNGLHGFSNVGNNFPPALQNKTVYVIDPMTGQSWSRSLEDPSSGLSQDEIDSLSVTAPQFFQRNKTLYVVGGYGINTSTNEMETKSTLTAINLKKMIQWVIKNKHTAKAAILQVSDPLLQVTGGSLFQASDHDPFLLILGQNFQGVYRGDANGIYTKQIRKFWISKRDEKLYILPHQTLSILEDYRRRDLNVVPIMRHNKPAYVAYSGVFTLTTGVWTVPITIFPDGSSFEENPKASKTFKQAMNHYFCPTFGLYSTKTDEMFTVLPGGISYGFFSGGIFQTDSEIPFINQITTIKIDKHGNHSQHLMNNEYPFIVSTGSNPGNQLLFGAEAQFFRLDTVSKFYNSVLQLDALPSEPTIIGYIAGGIMSTVPNTTSITDSTASPYVFTVTLIPK